MASPLLPQTSPSEQQGPLHAQQDQQQRHDDAIVALLDSLFCPSEERLQQNQLLSPAPLGQLLQEKQQQQEQQQQEQQELSLPPECVQTLSCEDWEEQQQQEAVLLGVLHVAAFASEGGASSSYRRWDESMDSCGCCAADAASRAAAAAVGGGSFGREQFLRALASDLALKRGLFGFLGSRRGVCTPDEEWETDSSGEQQLADSLEEAHALELLGGGGASAAVAAAAQGDDDTRGSSFCLVDVLLHQQQDETAAAAGGAFASDQEAVFDMHAAFTPHVSPSLLQRFIRWKVLSPGLVDPFPLAKEQQQQQPGDQRLRQESDSLLLQQRQQLEELQQEKADLQQQLRQLQERCRIEAQQQQRLREQQQQHSSLLNSSCSSRLQLRKNTGNTNSSREEAAAASLAAGPFSTGSRLLQARRQRGLLSEEDEAAALHVLEQRQQQRQEEDEQKEEAQQARKKLRPHTSRMREREGEEQQRQSAAASSLSHYEELLGGDVTPDILQWVLRMRLAPPERPNRGSGPSQDGNQIAGLHRVKKLLRDKIINPILRPELHVGLHQAPRGILLFGPPGTGKTTLAKWMAAASGATFFEVTPSSIISKFQGETETLIKALFKVAECDSPSLIFIDEIDSLLGKRREREDDASIRMKNQLLQMMDGVSSCSSDKILVVVGATNRPDMLDEAAIRRLTKRVLVPLPDAEAICVLIRNVLEGQAVGGCALTQEELKQLAARLDGWSGSDVRSLCVSASERSYDETVAKFGGIQFVPSRSAFRPISYDDFLEALKEVRPSCASTASLEFFDSWAKAHGAL